MTRALERYTRKGLRRSVIILTIVLTLVTNAFFPTKADAFIKEVVIGGLTLGEATFIALATVLATGTVYEVYDNWEKYSVVGKYTVEGAKLAWKNLSSTAKSAWAATESAIVASGDAVYNFMATADQWAQARLASILSYGTTQAYTPAVPLPQSGENFGTHDFFVKYAILTMTYNGVNLALMPTASYSGGSIGYGWYFYYSPTYEGGYPRWERIKSGGYRPSELLTFVPISIYIMMDYTRPAGLYDIQHDNGVVSGLTFTATNSDEALKLVLDANAMVHELMLNRYGSLNPAFPQPWADVYPLPQAQNKTKTWDKPVSIPFPPGAITYPQGQAVDAPGTLTLSIDQIKQIVGDIVDTATPGNPTGPKDPDGKDKDKPSKPWAPLLILPMFLDMLKAILAYLVRLIKFITTIPLIPAVPLNNSGLQMFFNLGFGTRGSPYFPNLLPIDLKLIDLVRTMITIFLSFVVFKVIRRFFGGS